MSQLTFDTLAYVKRLENGGIPKEYAEAITNAQKYALSEMIATRELATKKDLIELQLNLEGKLATLKNDLIKWIAGTMASFLGIMIAGFVLVISLLS